MRRGNLGVGIETRIKSFLASSFSRKALLNCCFNYYIPRNRFFVVNVLAAVIFLSLLFQSDLLPYIGKYSIFYYDCYVIYVSCFLMISIAGKVSAKLT